MKTLAVAVVSIAAVCAAMPANAQGRSKSPTEITVANARAATVTGLSLTGEDGKVYGTLKAPLASGKSLKLRLAKKAPCLLNVAANFDDETDGVEGQVDACTDKTLRLTD